MNQCASASIAAARRVRWPKAPSRSKFSLWLEAMPCRARGGISGIGGIGGMGGMGGMCGMGGMGGMPPMGALPSTMFATPATPAPAPAPAAPDPFASLAKMP